MPNPINNQNANLHDPFFLSQFWYSSNMTIDNTSPFLPHDQSGLETSEGNNVAAENIPENDEIGNERVRRVREVIDRAHTFFSETIKQTEEDEYDPRLMHTPGLVDALCCCARIYTELGSENQVQQVIDEIDDISALGIGGIEPGTFTPNVLTHIALGKIKRGESGVEEIRKANEAFVAKKLARRPSLEEANREWFYMLANLKIECGIDPSEELQRIEADIQSRNHERDIDFEEDDLQRMKRRWDETQKRLGGPYQIIPVDITPELQQRMDTAIDSSDELTLSHLADQFTEGGQYDLAERCVSSIKHTSSRVSASFLTLKSVCLQAEKMLYAGGSYESNPE